MHVEFHAVADARGGVEGGDGVFGDALVHLVQPAVGVIAAVKRRVFFIVAPCGRYHEGKGPGGSRTRGGEPDHKLFTHLSADLLLPRRKGSGLF